MSIDFRDLNGYRQLPGQGTSAEVARETAADRAASERSVERAAAEDQSASSDRVELSPTARTLRTLEATAESTDGVDAARVERIRAEIASGRYHVDAGKLADRMIDLERTLLG